MKSLLLLPILLMSVFISGCTKNEYVTPNQTIITTVRETDWKEITANSTWGVTISLPELNDQANRDFGVVVSISGDGNTFEALPEAYGGYTYTYTHEPGFLTLETQRVDGTTGNRPPGDITVKIVLVESQE